MSKKASDIVPKLENRMVLAPTKAAPSAPMPWVAEPASNRSAQSSAAELMAAIVSGANMPSTMTAPSS